MFVDSTSPWERPVSSAASIAARCAAIRRWSCTNAGIRERRAQLDPSVERVFAFFAFDREHVTQSFFEEVRAPQPRVGLGDPVELMALPAGEIAGVLPQRVARFGDVLRVAGRAALAGETETGWSAGLWLGSRRGAVRYRARRSPTRRHGTDRRSATRSGPGAATTRAIQSAISAETWVSSAARSGPSSSKNTLQGGVVAARSGPHEPAAVMIDDHDQIAVPALVGDLVDPDPAQPVETDRRSRRCPR